MTNSKEMLPQYRDQPEEEIKDVFIWAIGQSALLDGKRKRTNFFTIVPSICTVQTTLCPRAEQTP